MAVDAGHRALIFDLYQGIKPTVYGEGTHFRIPILQRPILMDVRTRPKQVNTQTGTKDLQVRGTRTCSSSVATH